LACAICETRKEKRFCPAVHGRICPTCCGTEREVTLDCPSTCDYLQQARRNERPRHLGEIDREALFPKVKLPEEVAELQEPLIGALGYAIVQVAQRDRSLLDRDVVAALTGVGKGYQTAIESGLLYDAPLQTPLQQRIASDLRRAILEYQQSERKRLAYSVVSDSDALKAVVFLLRFALVRSNGRPRSRAFLDALEGGYPQRDSLLVTPHDPGSRLIIP